MQTLNSQKLDVGQFSVAGQDVTMKLGEAVEGVSITVFIGGAAVYGLILPDQDPNWATGNTRTRSNVDTCCVKME